MRPTDHLKLDCDFESAMRKLLQKQRPAGGWKSRKRKKVGTKKRRRGSK